MFGTVIDRLQSLLSRSFVIASFFPVLIFAVVNAAITAVAFPETAAHVYAEWLRHPEMYTALVLVGIGIAAYLLAPLAPAFRVILEAEFLPDFLRNRLRHRYIRAGDRARQKIREAISAYHRAREQRPQEVANLQAARQEGSNQVTANHPFAIRRAQFGVWLLGWERRHFGLARRVTMERASRWLDRALRLNSASLLADSPQYNRSRLLNRIHGDFLNELTVAVVETELRLKRCIDQRGRSMLPADARPTRLGNLRAVVEGYVATAYGVDFDFLWPRMQLVLARDDKFAPRVEAAKAQLDFALLLLMLNALIPTIWLPLLAWKARTPWLFLGIGLGSPLLFAFFQQLVWETQRGFGEVLKAAVDGSRLEVLKLLHLPLSTRLAKERDTWVQLAHALEAGGDVRLRHDST